VKALKLNERHIGRMPEGAVGVVNSLCFNVAGRGSYMEFDFESEVCSLNQARDSFADRSAFLIKFASFVSRDRATVVTSGLPNCPKREEG
jgi:hypothetical protein